MVPFIFLLASALAGYATALPSSSSHLVHEKRVTTSWQPVDGARPDNRILLPVRIGLTQSNLDEGHDLLMGVSDPKSEKYGKHWKLEDILSSAIKIASKFRPAQNTIDTVQDWLRSSGIDLDRLQLSGGENWIFFNATISEMEKLLHTEYKVYKHESGQPHVGCDEYSLPEHVKPHVDLVMPTVHFDVKIRPEYEKRSQMEKRKFTPGSINNPWKPKKGKVISNPGGATPNAAQPAVSFSLANCNTYITPDCLRALYNFPNGTLAKSSYGIVEYTPQAFLQSDLNVFYSNLARQIPSGTAPTLDSIDGGVDQTTTTGFEYNGESDLDLEYAIALVYPQKVTLYQVGDLQQGASFNNFLDALDASYCTSGGGDSPT
ncbi:MAG: hypothetical protein Q9227_005041 [Pyrenula ochraceoflavens]